MGARRRGALSEAVRGGRPVRCDSRGRAGAACRLAATEGHARRAHVVPREAVHRLARRWLARLVLGGMRRLALPVSALVPGMAGKLRPVLERHPEAESAHSAYGVPAGHACAGGVCRLDELLALARYPNVVVMVSSAPCFSNEPYPFRDLHRISGASTIFSARAGCCGAPISAGSAAPTRNASISSERSSISFGRRQGMDLGRRLAEALNWPSSAGLLLCCLPARFHLRSRRWLPKGWLRWATGLTTAWKFVPS